MSSKLFLFQIGPVQAFIAQARRTQDLYIGSRMLSELARSGIAAAAALPSFEPIFPMWNDARVFPASVPHRFAFLSAEPSADAAAAVKDAVEHEWRTRFAGRVQRWLTDMIGSGEWQTVFERQTSHWLEFNWVAVDHNADSHGASFQSASAAMRTRRLARAIYPIDEPGDKCTLTGAQAALPINWEQFRAALNDPDEMILRKNEKLGTLALIKRFAGRDFANCQLKDERFPSTDAIAGVPPKEQRKGKDVRGYLAVLHMDGDRMGAHLSSLKTVEEHQKFSRILTKFADEIVPRMVDGYDRAALVYAGGDDVLALLPMNIALDVADRLQEAFRRETGLSASAGIAITPYNLPLDTALELARKAEETAKDDLGRNAVVITEAHGTGQTREAGSQWKVGGGIAAMMRQAQQDFADGAISGKLAYDVQQIAHDMAAVSIPAAARQAELGRLVKRRLGEGLSMERRERIATDFTRLLCAFGESQACGWDMLANWLILARFLAQGQAKQKEMV